jgi:ribosomal-protein-alanine N-acetyltransferase
MEGHQLIFTLENATLSDLGDLGEMERICFPLDAWPLLERIGALVLPSVVRIKAVIAGKMIGFVGGDIRRRAGIGWITTISVLPEYRRAGVAETLLAACEQEMGMPRVRLAVRRRNTAAQALYLKHGYQTVETWRHYYQGGEDGIVMEKVIDPNSA